MFNSDQPINDVSEDLLDRGSFAQKIAKAIKSYNSSECLTIGIYGDWGEGKSSLANMISSEIMKRNDNEAKFVVINFNAWLYSNKEDLISQMFKEISDVFNFSDVGEAVETVSTVVDKIGQAAGVIKYFPIPIVKEIANTISGLFGEYADFLRGDHEGDNLTNIKSKIDLALKNNNTKLMIVIDDFDRLNQDEIRLMFQVVKILGNFNNTIYLLLMDKDVVVKSLEKVQGGNGEEYLKKIVQVPITISHASKNQLSTVMHNEFERILSHDKYFDIQELFDELVKTCVLPFITNIRDIKRILNLFEFKNSFLNDEVNQADLFVLCTLELYVTEAYSYIQNNKKELLISNWRNRNITKMHSDIHSFALPTNEKYIENCFNKIFSKDTTKLTRGKFRRLFDWNYFDSFFSLSLPLNIIPSHIIDSVVYSYTKEEIQELITSTKYISTELINEICSNFDNIPSDRLITIFEAMKLHYNQLITQRSVNKILVHNLLTKLLDKMSFEDVKKCFNNADFGSDVTKEVLIFIDFFIAQEHYNHKMFDISYYDEIGVLNSDQLAEIESICKSKINDVNLFCYDQPDFKVLFYLWRDLDYKGCKSYINHFRTHFNNSDINLVLSMTEVKDEHYIINFKELERYVNLRDLHDSIKNHNLIKKLQGQNKECIEAFMYYFDIKKSDTLKNDNGYAYIPFYFNL